MQLNSLVEQIPGVKDVLDDLVERLPTDDLPAVQQRAQMIKAKLPSIVAGLKILGKKDKFEPLSIGTYLERNAEKFPHHPALLFENASYSHRTFNMWVNRYANLLRKEGFKKGDVAAVLLENRPEVLVVVAALAKLGAISALINTNQREEALVHSLKLSQAKAFIVGEELFGAFDTIRGKLDLQGAPLFWLIDRGRTDCPAGFRDLAAESDVQSSENPPTTGTVFLKDPCFYVYTSGTTGLPKASIMTHFRWIKASAGFGLCGLNLQPGDVIYVPLPLYHNNALTVTWASASVNGSAVAIRRKFSARHFWEDTRKFNAKAFCYIGELCRYLMNQPPRPDDKDNPVLKCVGNGMRPDIWKAFKERFGIEEVYEFYGASECNVAFINLLNVDCTVGLCPLPYNIVKYDVEKDEPVRDSAGHFVACDVGETGLLIAKITEKTPFDGYTNKEANEKKLFHNCFEDGDTWYNSGDLMKNMGFRHAQFVDRLGDTFRWKGENVSTTEVEEVINKVDAVAEATVYGVEVAGTDGRAGMASVVFKGSIDDFDGKSFAKHCKESLPAYAVPLFLRLRSELEVTGTFKHRKVELKKEGFDPELVSEPVYALLPGTDEYVKVTKKLKGEIDKSKYKF
jgi:citronellyl-CoA synthetase